VITVGAEEFGYAYARFLQRAAAGESFLVTRRGRPMARISPPDTSCAANSQPV
jgi:antitoxin (DNA-binding transcriptional repressor) of toxin-antitoxin stability system